MLGRERTEKRSVNDGRAAIRAGGALHPIPQGTVQGVPGSLDAVAQLLSAGGLAAMAAESTLPPLRSTAGYSVGGLIRQRLGDEVVDRLVDPLLAGVYAGRADELGLRATMPALATRAEELGSVLAAARSLLPPRSADGRVAPVFGAIEGGYARLIEGLRGAAEIELHQTVSELSRTATGWRIGVGAAAARRYREVDAVVLAVPAPAARDLLAQVSPAASRALAGIELASMVVLGLELPPQATLPQRSGVLLASGERHRGGVPFTAKAFTFSGRKWPHLPGTVLRASVGRFGDHELLRRDDEELTAGVRADLAELTGIEVAPRRVIVARWGGGLPQYGIGHEEVIARVETEIASLPGLELAGSVLHGVGVAPCIATAACAAARLTSVVPDALRRA
ncbi:MAG: protoporphyrinogen oxidase [Sciscionella sp.]